MKNYYLSLTAILPKSFSFLIKFFILFYFLIFSNSAFSKSSDQVLKIKKKSYEQLLQRINRSDGDDGLTNPFDWFGMHDQKKINSLNGSIKKQKVINNIVTAIHISHENKHQLMEKLIWSKSKDDLEDLEELANVVVVVAAVVAAVVIPELIAGGSIATSFELEVAGTVISTNGSLVAMGPAGVR